MEHRGYDLIKFPGHGRPQECSDMPLIVSLTVGGKPQLLIQQQEDLTVDVNPCYSGFDEWETTTNRCGLRVGTPIYMCHYGISGPRVCRRLQYGDYILRDDD